MTLLIQNIKKRRPYYLTFIEYDEVSKLNKRANYVLTATKKKKKTIGKVKDIYTR